MHCYLLDIFESWDEADDAGWRGGGAGQRPGGVGEEGPLDPAFEDGGLFWEKMGGARRRRDTITFSRKRRERREGMHSLIQCVRTMAYHQVG